MWTSDRWRRVQGATGHGGAGQVHRRHPVLRHAPWAANVIGRAARLGKSWQWFVDWNAGMKEAVMTMIQCTHLSPCHPRIPETYFLRDINSPNRCHVRQPFRSPPSFFPSARSRVESRLPSLHSLRSSGYVLTTILVLLVDSTPSPSHRSLPLKGPLAANPSWEAFFDV